MQKVSCRKNKKEPDTAQRYRAVIIELYQPAQQYRRSNRSDARDDKPGSKITSTDISDQPKEARKQRVKRKRAVSRLVSKFCNLLVKAEISLIPWLVRTSFDRSLTSVEVILLRAYRLGHRFGCCGDTVAQVGTT